MTTKTTHRPFILTILVVTLFLSYNFINAAWTAPSANPPTDNTEAPLNVGTTGQTKNGRLNLRAGTDLNVATSTLMFRTNGNAMANIFAAGSQMRSNLYCNSTGGECLDQGDIYKVVNSTTTVEGLRLGDNNFPVPTINNFYSLCPQHNDWVDIVFPARIRDLNLSYKNGQLAMLYTISNGGGDSCTIANSGGAWFLDRTTSKPGGGGGN